MDFSRVKKMLNVLLTRDKIVYIELIKNLNSKGGVIQVCQDQELMMRGEEVNRIFNNQSKNNY